METMGSRWWLWLIGVGAAIEFVLWLSTVPGYEVLGAPAFLNPWLFFCAMGLTMAGMGLAVTADRESIGTMMGYMALGFVPIAGPLGFLTWLAVDQWYARQQNPTLSQKGLRLAAGLAIIGSLFLGLVVLSHVLGSGR